MRYLKLDGVTHLLIAVPAPHDLIVMKLLRGAEHDIEAAAQIATHENVTLEVLLEAMGETFAVGDLIARRYQFRCQSC